MLYVYSVFDCSPPSFRPTRPTGEDETDSTSRNRLQKSSSAVLNRIMPFPVSIENYVKICLQDEADGTRVIEGVRGAIRKERSKDITDERDSIIFAGEAFGTGFFNKWSPLSGIGSGEIRFLQHNKEITIYYRLSLLQPLIIFGAAVVFLFVLLPALMATRTAPFSESVGPTALVWFLLSSVQYLVLRSRFPRFIRAAATRSLHD